MLFAKHELAALSPKHTFHSIFRCGDIFESKFSTVTPKSNDSNEAITESSVGVEDIMPNSPLVEASTVSAYSDKGINENKMTNMPNSVPCLLTDPAFSPPLILFPSI